MSFTTVSDVGGRWFEAELRGWHSRMKTEGQGLVGTEVCCWGHICEKVSLCGSTGCVVHERMLYVTTKGQPSTAMVVLNRCHNW